MLSSLFRPVRRRWISASLVSALLVLFMFTQHEAITASSTFNYYTRPRAELVPKQGNFWKLFRADLEKYGPHVPPLVHPENVALNIGFNATIQRSRPDYLKMYVTQWEALSKSHSSFVEKIRSRQYHLPYTANTRGIVTTAGGPYLPVALVSIRMLRETGSHLPIEVFLSNWSEWDPVICSKIFPVLNAKCVVLQDVFDYDKKTRHSDLGRYQYKIMAILFSSFEDVLFLDSDCFPLHNPDQLFETEPFSSTGLVLWPDFWYPSESPLFFEIASIQEPKIYQRPSTEAGEILYSKRDHEIGLLLAAYYNYYGPQFYYPLQSQGGPGEGDKETFLWSSIVLGLPYYTVNTAVRALGYKTKDGEWRGSAMAQFDPIQDHHPDKENKQTALDANSTYPRPFFIHANFPKLDPGQVFDKESFGATGPTKDSDTRMRRIWHKDERDAINFFGFDVERQMWSIVKEIACKYERRFVSWNGRKDICKKATEYWDTVFGDKAGQVG